MSEKLTRALNGFDANAFALKHGGYKESRSAMSYEWLLPCPLCGSERLRWHHEPRSKQGWICWGCRRTGDTVYLVQLMERCTEADALGYVLDGYVGGDAPVELSEIANEPISSVARAERLTVERLDSIRWPDGVELLSPSAPHHADAYRYLAGRGLRLKDMLDYRLGVGLRGRLKNYVVFPVFMDSALVFWQGRAMWDPPAHLSKVERKAWEKATNYRKTLNPYGVRSDRVLFNHDRAKTSWHVVVCEGPVDAMKVGPNAVAMLGKFPSPMKIERLLRMPARQYSVYLDSGDAEREAAEHLAAELSAFAPTFIATPPVGRDPGNLSFTENAEVLSRGVAYRGKTLKSGLNMG